MPVYAPTPRFAEQRRHPRALLLIVAGHAALIAAVMTVKMELPQKIVRGIIEVELIDPPAPPPPPPPPEPQPKQQPRQSESLIDRPVNIVPIPPSPTQQLDFTPIPLPPPSTGDQIGPKVDVPPQPDPPRPIAEPVRTGPRFATPPSQVRPPYPPEKLMREEETALRLRLRIDERGRVTSVEPVGKADRSFLQAARRHLIANWRYRPATEDGRPVPSSTVITLRFELTG